MIKMMKKKIPRKKKICPSCKWNFEPNSNFEVECELEEDPEETGYCESYERRK